MRTLPDRLMVRNGTFYFRLWIPKDILPLFGRQLVVTSLRTKDLKTAKSRLARKTVEAEERFEVLRSVGGGTGQRDGQGKTITAGDYASIAAAHASDVHDREFEQRANLYMEATREPARLWSGDLMRLPTATDRDGSEAYTYFDHLVADGDMDKIIGYLNRHRIESRIKDLKRMRTVGDFSDMVAIAEHRAPGGDRKKVLRLARMLIDSEIAVLEAIAKGEPISIEPDVLPRGGAVTSQPLDVEDRAEQIVFVTEAVSIDQVFSKWEAETEPSASTLSSWRGIVRDLKSFLGPKASDIRSITSSDIVKWKDKLVKDGKAAATISRGYLGCARALFRFAISNHMVAEDPTEGIKVIRKAKAGTRMLAYSNEEVGRLLSLASKADEPWKRWLPLLAAATGSRIGEVAQLHGSHVKEEEGYHVLKIQPAQDAGTIKNESSERTVPIHSALVKAGFLDFVRARGQGPLFYTRSSGDPKRKHASKGVSNRLAGWIRASGFDDPRKAPNHALRHWFKTEASRVGISDSVADAIQGHSDGKSSSVYRHISIHSMAVAIEEIQIPSS